MFLKSEIRNLEALYTHLFDENLEDFLDDRAIHMLWSKGRQYVDDILSINELNHIKSKGLTYDNLRNYLFVPKHFNKPEATIRFQRLCNEDFNLGDWLDKIAANILYSPDMLVEIGHSFICKVGLSDEITYMFSAKSLATYRRKISNYEEFTEFAKDMGKLSTADFLRQVFWEANDTNRFHRSGWVPVKLVCNYIWITK